MAKYRIKTNGENCFVQKRWLFGYLSAYSSYGKDELEFGGVLITEFGSYDSAKEALEAHLNYSQKDWFVAAEYETGKKEAIENGKTKDFV